MAGIEERLAGVERRIAAACARAGRRREEVTLIAVSKTRPRADLGEAFAAGIRNFGENRVQEAAGKVAQGRPAGARLHLVGHLQKNKAAEAAQLFDVIHSLDSVELLERLEARATRPLELLIQVDLAGEASKFGMVPDAVPVLLARAEKLERVRVVGLMCLPPWFDDAERVRPYFRRLFELREGLGGAGRLPQLSMGMSHDFEVAIEEGATWIRVGEAVFGPRLTPHEAARTGGLA